MSTTCCRSMLPTSMSTDHRLLLSLSDRSPLSASHLLFNAGSVHPRVVLRSRHLGRKISSQIAVPWWPRPEDKESQPSVVVPSGFCQETTGDSHGEQSSSSKKAEVIVAALLTVVLGVGNRVLYKLALVPLKHYPFFLAQLATFGYVVVYFSILYCRYQIGIVTNEMLSLPKSHYLAVGLLEALGAASGMAAGAILSGASIPILSQTFLVWQLLLSMAFLGRRYSFNQILGCLFVVFGVIITVASGSGAGQLLKETGIFWTLLMIVSFLFQAADTVLKGGSVDLFVVNSFGSAFQALFICLLLPFLSKLWGVPFYQLPSYLRDGAACFLNLGSLSSAIMEQETLFESLLLQEIEFGTQRIMFHASTILM